MAQLNFFFVQLTPHCAQSSSSGGSPPSLSQATCARAMASSSVPVSNVFYSTPGRSGHVTHAKTTSPNVRGKHVGHHAQQAYELLSYDSSPIAGGIAGVHLQKKTIEIEVKHAH